MTAIVSKTLRKKFTVKETIAPFYLGGTATYSSDGERIYCLFRNQIKIINVSSGKPIATLGSEDDDDITCIALSPNDELLVAATKRLLMVRWDLTAIMPGGEPKTPLGPPGHVTDGAPPSRSWKAVHQLPVEVMAFDSTSSLLATGGADGTVKVFDIHHSYTTHNLRIHKGVVKILHFHPDISRLQLITSSGDFKIRVWNLQTSEAVAVLEKHFSVVTCVAFSRDGDALFSSSCDRVVIKWNLKTFEPVTITPLSEDIRALVVLPPGSLSKLHLKAAHAESDLVLCVASSGRLRVVDPVTSSIVYFQKESSIGSLETDGADQLDSLVSTAMFVPRLDVVAVLTNHHHIFHFKVQDLSLEKQFMGNNDEVIDLKLINASSLLAVATNSPEIKLYDMETMSCQLLRGHSKTVLGLDFHDGRHLLASVAKDATCRLWSYADPKHISCVAVATGHTKSVIACAMSTLQGAFLLTGGEDLTLKMWKIPSKLTATPEAAEPRSLKSVFTSVAHSKDINSVAVSPNDRFVATASQDKTAKLWSREDGKLLGVCQGHKRGIWCVKFSTVDQILATASADGSLRLWALSDFTCIKSLDAHDASVLRVAFVSRGMQLLSCGADGTVKIWTIKNSECMGTFDVHDAKIWAMESISDGDGVVTGGADGKVIFLDDVTEVEELEEVKKKESRVLQDQKFANCIHKKDFVAAFKLALDLDRPRDLLKISKLILTQADWRTKLEGVISELNSDQVDALLSHVKTWNTSGRTSGVAQTLLEFVLRAFHSEDLKDVPNILSSLEGLIPFTQRHHDRLLTLTQQTTFLDYLWNTMKLEECTGDVGEDGDADGDADADDHPMDTDSKSEKDNDSGVVDGSDLDA